MTYQTPKYLEHGDWPIFRSPSGKMRRAADNYGDVECPFCDVVVLHEQEEFDIGKQCWNCNAKISKVEEA